MKFFKDNKTRDIKRKARRGLNNKFGQNYRNYVVDTSSIINKFLPKLIRKGLKGKILIPNAVMAELENQANRGREEGFIGLEEITKLHKMKQIKIIFSGLRPNEHQIRFAKSGEIDALIRETARKNQAILITSDLVQAKTSQAYGLEVLYLKPFFKKEKKFRFWKTFSKLKKK